MRFRDQLKQVRELDDWRMDRRRDGSRKRGPFRFERRQQLLAELLDLEREVGEELISDEEIAYIQGQWAQEFDLKQSAYTIAAEHGRSVGPMDNIALPPMDQQVLDELVAEHDIDPDLVDRLLKLVLVDYPDLRVWGSKAALEREVASAIAASVAHAANADHTEGEG